MLCMLNALGWLSAVEPSEFKPSIASCRSQSYGAHVQRLVVGTCRARRQKARPINRVGRPSNHPSINLTPPHRPSLLPLLSSISANLATNSKQPNPGASATGTTIGIGPRRESLNGRRDAAAALLLLLIGRPPATVFASSGFEQSKTLCCMSAATGPIQQNFSDCCARALSLLVLPDPALKFPPKTHPSRPLTRQASSIDREPDNYRCLLASFSS